VSELTTDVVTYCIEASNQKSKYAYRKILFYKKALLQPLLHNLPPKLPNSVKLRKLRAITPLKVIQGQSKAHMQLPISD